MSVKDSIVYHWFPIGIDLGKCRRLDGYAHQPVIYEYACGQLGSPFHGPHQMHQLISRSAQWNGVQQRIRTRDGQLHETNCPACKAIWDALDARSGLLVPFDMRLKYFKEVTQRKTLVDFRSAERLDTISCAAQFGEEHPY